MDARARMAEMELMEKLAALETDEAPAAAPQPQKTAAERTVDPVKRAEKIASLVKMARRAGAARAEADLMAFFDR